MTGAIDEEHLGAAVEGFAECAGLVQQVAACAMNEDEGRKIGGVGARNMYGIHAIAANIGQFADIGVGMFELAGLVGGIANGRSDGSEKGRDFGKHGFNRTVTISSS
jgi:hypothetical protein